MKDAHFGSDIWFIQLTMDPEAFFGWLVAHFDIASKVTGCTLSKMIPFLFVTQYSLIIVNFYWSPLKGISIF
jgi:hypothetical protein